MSSHTTALAVRADSAKAGLEHLLRYHENLEAGIATNVDRVIRPSLNRFHPSHKRNCFHTTASREAQGPLSQMSRALTFAQTYDMSDMTAVSIRPQSEAQLAARFILFILLFIDTQIASHAISLLSFLLVPHLRRRTNSSSAASIDHPRFLRYMAISTAWVRFTVFIRSTSGV